jgi:hypothetical protein
MIPITNTINVSSIKTLGTSNIKNSIDRAYPSFIEDNPETLFINADNLSRLKYITNHITISEITNQTLLLKFFVILLSLLF